MAKTRTLYKTDIYINKVPIGWTKEISFEADYGNQQEPTHSGRMTRNSRFPGCKITIKKLTKFDPVQENAVIRAIDSLALSGGTVTMITKEPKGTLVINAFGCRPDSEEWTNEADEFLETEFSLEGEEWTREFKKS